MSEVTIPQKPLDQTDRNGFIPTMSNGELVCGELRAADTLGATHHSGRAGGVDFVPRRLWSSRVEFCPSDLAQ